MSLVPGSRARPPLGSLAGLADTGWAWPDPVVLETTPSTMAEIEERAAAGAPEGTVVVAEEQTAGRGRRGRTWESAPRAGLWWSLLLRPRTPADRAGWLPLVVGVGVARAIRDQVGVDARLKWPNDVIVITPEGIAKVAGILAERLPDGAIVVGVGTNVDHEPDELPPGGGSLRSVGAHHGEDERIDRTRLLVAILASVADAYRAWQAGVDPRSDYEHLSATLGGEVSVDVGARRIIGRASALGPSGELIVRTSDGTEEMVSAGDVTLLRPAP